MLLQLLLLSQPMVANQSTQLAESLVQFQAELPQAELRVRFQAEVRVQFQAELLVQFQPVQQLLPLYQIM